VNLRRHGRLLVERWLYSGMRGLAAQREGDFASAQKLHAKALKGAASQRDLAQRVYNAVGARVCRGW